MQSGCKRLAAGGQGGRMTTAGGVRRGRVPSRDRAIPGYMLFLERHGWRGAGERAGGGLKNGGRRGQSEDRETGP